MQNRVIKSAAAAVTAVILASAAQAEVKINDSFSTTGYVAGSYGYTDSNGTSEKLDLDVAKTLFTYSAKPVTGVVSLWYTPSTENVKILDAYASYDAGGGFTVTGGNFLSYLGYEAWDLTNMDQITYGSTIFAVPGYHTGVKLDYSDSNIGYGVAVLDSVYNGSEYLKGDGEFKDNRGFEGYLSYKGIKDVTIWTGFGYDKNSNTDDVFTWDLWASYVVSKQLRVAAEVDTSNSGHGTSYGWLAFANYSFDDKVSLALRVSGNDLKSYDGEGGESSVTETKYTIAPTYTLTSNLLVRAEYSHTALENDNNSDYVGVQALFKW